MASTIAAGTTSGTAIAIAGDTSGVLQLQTNGTTAAVTINTSQNVGIGTSSPSVKLHVSTSSAGLAEPFWLNNSQAVGANVGSRLVFTGTSSNNGLAAIDGAFAGATTADGGYMAFNTRAVTSGTLTERMRIDSSGNVGINITPEVWSTTNSTRALQISSRGSIWANVNSTSINNNWYLASGDVSKYIDTAAATRYVQDATGIHQWFYAASGSADATMTLTEAMRIDSSGNVLVNTTSSTGHKMTVQAASSAGAIDCVGTSTNGYYALRVDMPSTNTYGVLFRNNGNNVGDIRVNASSTAYNTSSDYRLKENILPMTGALNKVAQLKPVTYDWKAGGSSQGFIAHELQAVVPDAVTGEKDAVNEDGSIKPQGIDTSFLVATLTAALQELNAKVEAQAVRIAELEGAK